jgi:hypothetical protein
MHSIVLMNITNYLPDDYGSLYFLLLGNFWLIIRNYSIIILIYTCIITFITYLMYLYKLYCCITVLLYYDKCLAHLCRLCDTFRICKDLRKVNIYDMMIAVAPAAHYIHPTSCTAFPQPYLHNISVKMTK